jgi:hypothetical protein
MEWRKDDYLITDDKSKVQLDTVHRLLTATYWGGRRPKETVERMVAGSICFSLYRDIIMLDVIHEMRYYIIHDQII